MKMKMNQINLESQNSIFKIYKQIESIRKELAFEVEKLLQTSVEKLYGNQVLDSCEKVQQVNNQLTFLIVQLTLLEMKNKNKFKEKL